MRPISGVGARAPWEARRAPDRGGAGRVGMISPGQAEGNDNYRLPFDKLRRPSSIPGGSAHPSCGRCNDAYRIGGRCMVRIRRCTSPRCIRRDGRPS